MAQRIKQLKARVPKHFSTQTAELFLEITWPRTLRIKFNSKVKNKKSHRPICLSNSSKVNDCPRKPRVESNKRSLTDLLA